MHDTDITPSLADCLTGMLWVNPNAAFQWTAAILDILNIPLTKWPSTRWTSFMVLVSSTSPQLIVN